jgi:hypothetical protein
MSQIIIHKGDGKECQGKGGRNRGGAEPGPCFKHTFRSLDHFYHPCKKRGGRGHPSVLHTPAGLGSCTTRAGSAAFAVAKLVQCLVLKMHVISEADVFKLPLITRNFTFILGNWRTSSKVKLARFRKPKSKYFFSYVENRSNANTSNIMKTGHANGT